MMAQQLEPIPDGPDFEKSLLEEAEDMLAEISVREKPSSASKLYEWTVEHRGPEAAAAAAMAVRLSTKIQGCPAEKRLSLLYAVHELFRRASKDLERDFDYAAWEDAVRAVVPWAFRKQNDTDQLKIKKSVLKTWVNSGWMSKDLVESLLPGRGTPKKTPSNALLRASSLAPGGGSGSSGSGKEVTRRRRSSSGAGVRGDMSSSGAAKRQRTSFSDPSKSESNGGAGEGGLAGAATERDRTSSVPHAITFSRAGYSPLGGSGSAAPTLGSAQLPVPSAAQLVEAAAYLAKVATAPAKAGSGGVGLGSRAGEGEGGSNTVTPSPEESHADGAVPDAGSSGESQQELQRKALSLKLDGCGLIRRIGKAMKFPVRVMLTAFHLFHHYQWCGSVASFRFHPGKLPAVCLACLLVATKAEDCNAKLETLLQQMRQLEPILPPLEGIFPLGQRPSPKEVVDLEYKVLLSRGFDLEMVHPTEHLPTLLTLTGAPVKVGDLAYEVLCSRVYTDSTLCLEEDPLTCLCAAVQFCLLSTLPSYVKHLEGISKRAVDDWPMMYGATKADVLSFTERLVQCARDLADIAPGQTFMIPRPSDPDFHHSGSITRAMSSGGGGFPVTMKSPHASGKPPDRSRKRMSTGGGGNSSSGGHERSIHAPTSSTTGSRTKGSASSSSARLGAPAAPGGMAAAVLAKAAGVPTKSVAVVGKAAVAVPAKAVEFPAKAVGVSAKTVGASAKTMEASVKTVGVPAKTMEASAKAVGVPAKTSGVPAKAVGVPAKTSGVPAKAVGVPAKTSGVSAKTSGVPAKALGISAKAVGVPSKAVVMGSSKVAAAVPAKAAAVIPAKAVAVMAKAAAAVQAKATSSTTTGLTKGAQAKSPAASGSGSTRAPTTVGTAGKSTGSSTVSKTQAMQQHQQQKKTQAAPTATAAPPVNTVEDMDMDVDSSPEPEVNGLLTLQQGLREELARQRKSAEEARQPGGQVGGVQTGSQVGGVQEGGQGSGAIEQGVGGAALGGEHGPIGETGRGSVIPGAGAKGVSAVPPITHPPPHPIPQPPHHQLPQQPGIVDPVHSNPPPNPHHPHVQNLGPRPGPPALTVSHQHLAPPPLSAHQPHQVDTRRPPILPHPGTLLPPVQQQQQPPPLIHQQQLQQPPSVHPGHHQPPPLVQPGHHQPPPPPILQHQLQSLVHPQQQQHEQPSQQPSQQPPRHALVQQQQQQHEQHQLLRHQQQQPPQHQLLQQQPPQLVLQPPPEQHPHPGSGFLGVGLQPANPPVSLSPPVPRLIEIPPQQHQPHERLPYPPNDSAAMMRHSQGTYPFQGTGNNTVGNGSGSSGSSGGEDGAGRFQNPIREKPYHQETNHSRPSSSSTASAPDGVSQGTGGVPYGEEEEGVPYRQSPGQAYGSGAHENRGVVGEPRNGQPVTEAHGEHHRVLPPLQGAHHQQPPHFQHGVQHPHSEARGETLSDASSALEISLPPGQHERPSRGGNYGAGHGELANRGGPNAPPGGGIEPHPGSVEAAGERQRRPWQQHPENRAWGPGSGSGAGREMIDDEGGVGLVRDVAGGEVDASYLEEVLAPPSAQAAPGSLDHGGRWGRGAGRGVHPEGWLP